MKRFLLSAAVATAFAGVGVPHASAYLATAVVNIANTDNGAPGATVGDTFTTTTNPGNVPPGPSGYFTSYVVTKPGTDPVLAGADLNFYRFTLNGTVDSVTGNEVDYSGTYTIFYDLNLDGVNNEGLNVSSGTFTATADFFPPNDATFTGELDQTASFGAPFGDLSNGGHPTFIITPSGYIGNLANGGATGTLSLTLENNGTDLAPGAPGAPVPEPVTAGLSLSALASLAAYVTKRRRA